MQIQRTEQQEMIAQMLQRYIQQNCAVPQVTRENCENNDYEARHWGFLAEMGLLGIPFSEVSGGMGGDLYDVMAVMREIGRGLLLEPYLQCIVVAGRLLSMASANDEIAGLISKVIAGESKVGLAHYERAIQSHQVDVFAPSTTLSDTFAITGSKLLVPIPQHLDYMLVTATDSEGRVQLCMLPSSTEGINVRPYRGVDGHFYGEVTFNQVQISQSQILLYEDLSLSLEQTVTYATAAVCAEAVACIEQLVKTTKEHLTTRQQFGQPLSRFQTLKHRLVDCYVAYQQAEALLCMAGNENHVHWRKNVAAAKSLITKYALNTGHEAIQMHGGMGLTDELAVSHYHKRIVAFSLLFGDQSTHTDIFAQHVGLEDSLESSALPFGNLLNTEQQSFLAEVRGFLSEKVTQETRTIVEHLVNTFAEKATNDQWHQVLLQKGWLAPHWPAEWGGTSWSPIQRFLFEYECGLRGAPEQIPMGVRYVGPVLIHFGNEWQRSFFLPKLLSGEHYWAQGFSEPWAGSDLAAIKMTAERDGDHFVVNGTKIWTTHAHLANWIFCLVRTDKADKPQKGISFLLIDLTSEGIKIDPIPLMAGEREVNQVFFDNVRVPCENLVGESGRGWDYAKFLLEFERGGSVFSGRARLELNQVKGLARELRFAPRTIQIHQLAELEQRLLALELYEFQQAAAMTEGGSPGASASIIKLLASELRKDIAEMAVKVAGHISIEFNPAPDPFSDQLSQYPGNSAELVAIPRYLARRVESIYGGSSEIQREIISKQVLQMS